MKIYKEVFDYKVKVLKEKGPISCNFNGCSFKGPWDKFEKHSKEKHFVTYDKNSYLTNVIKQEEKTEQIK